MVGVDDDAHGVRCLLSTLWRGVLVVFQGERNVGTVNGELRWVYGLSSPVSGIFRVKILTEGRNRKFLIFNNLEFHCVAKFK